MSCNFCVPAVGGAAGSDSHLVRNPEVSCSNACRDTTLVPKYW